MKHVLPAEHTFTMARLLQSDLGAWRDCRFKSCRGAKNCIGGPRGTCLKTGGWPLCTQEGRARAEIAKTKKIWPGEKVANDETISERRWRRVNDIMSRLVKQAKLDATEPAESGKGGIGKAQDGWIGGRDGKGRF